MLDINTNTNTMDERENNNELKHLHSIRRLLEHDTSDAICPTCRISFDKGKRRKLIDTCGHERCYSCMFRNDQCPMCMKDVDGNNAQGYDTGIGGSTSTIVSPLGSPQPQLRSQVQRTNATALARYMQKLSANFNKLSDINLSGNPDRIIDLSGNPDPIIDLIIQLDII
uniref:RING-type domain-containing protein n=1 Tax=Glossina austeni TaxID=7395 RepID=A0A1A9UFV8_GLOAU